MNKKILKFLKILSVNILIIIVLLFFAEMYFVVEKYNEYRIFTPADKFEKMSFFEHSKSILRLFISRFRYSTGSFYKADRFREIYGSEYKNKPGIILLGCSYTYGVNINSNETFSAVLSDTIKRTVDNLGLPGEGIRGILNIISSDRVLNQFNIDKNNIQYVIYLYMYDHQRRLYINLHAGEPLYKIQNGTLVKRNINRFLLNSYITFRFRENAYIHSDVNYNWKLFCMYLRAIEQEIHKNFRNGDKETKFVVLVYVPSNGNEDWSLLENDNIEIVEANDLVEFDVASDEYKSFDGAHPNALLWQLLVPALVDKLDFE